METRRADVDDHMEGDTASEASQEYVEYEDTPPSDVIESKLKLSSDLEQSFTTFTGNTNGLEGPVIVPKEPMIGTDFTLTFYGTGDRTMDQAFDVRCHKFMLASRSKTFFAMFRANRKIRSFKIEQEFNDRAVAYNMPKYI